MSDIAVMLKLNPKLKEFLTPRQNEEAVKYVFYDQQSFAATTVPAVTNYFAALAANTEVGNTGDGQSLASQIAAGSRFLITSIRCSINSIIATPVDLNTAATVSDIWNDAYLLMYRTQLRLSIAGRPFLTAPTWMLPAGGGIAGDIGVDATATTAAGFVTNGWADCRNKFEGAWPLPPTVNFQVQILCPNAVTMLAVEKLTVALEGWLIRQTA